MSESSPAPAIHSPPGTRPAKLAAWLRRRIAWVAAFVVMLSAGAAAATYFASRGTTVSVVPVRRQEVVQTVVASGRVLAAARIAIAPVTMGRVVEVRARAGEAVEQGELLVRIDDAEALAAVDGARAAVLQADARLRQAMGANVQAATQDDLRAAERLEELRSQLARLESVAQAGGASPQSVSQARSDVAIARSARETSRIELSAARGVQRQSAVADAARAASELAAALARLASLRLEAPASGVLTTRSVEVGDVVSPGQELFLLVVEGPVEVRIDPDESTLALVAVGQSALVSPESYPDRRIPAIVSYVAPAVDAQRGTIEIRLRVPAPPPELRADMTVSVDIEVARRARAIVAPASAVRGIGTEHPWVLVAEAGRARRRAVTLGAIGEEVVEITRGLREAESVIRLEGVHVEAGARIRTRGE